MPGETIIRGTIVPETNPAGKPLDFGPLYLKPEDNGEPLLLVQSRMSAQAPVEHLANQSRSAFVHALGKTVEVGGYRVGSVLYGAMIVGPDDTLAGPSDIGPLRKP